MKKLRFNHTGHEQEIMLIENSSVDEMQGGRICWFGVMMSRNDIVTHAGPNCPSIGAGKPIAGACLYIDLRYSQAEMYTQIRHAEGDFRWLRLHTDEDVTEIVGCHADLFTILDETSNEEACRWLREVAE